jgi:hypothetical protein
LLPEPTEGVEVSVGGVAVIVYEDVYDPESIDNVRVAKVIENVTSLVALSYTLVTLDVARTLQLPTAVNVRTAVLELTVQPVVPALVTE